MVVQKMLEDGKGHLVVLTSCFCRRCIVRLPQILFSVGRKRAEFRLAGQRHLVTVFPKTLEVAACATLRFCVRLYLRFSDGFRSLRDGCQERVVRQRSLLHTIGDCVFSCKVRVVDVRNQLLDRPKSFVTPTPLAQLRSGILLSATAVLQSIWSVLLLLLLHSAGGYPMGVRGSGMANIRITKRHRGREASTVTAMQMGLFEHAIVPRLQFGQDVFERNCPRR